MFAQPKFTPAERRAKCACAKQTISDADGGGLKASWRGGLKRLPAKNRRNLRKKNLCVSKYGALQEKY